MVELGILKHFLTKEVYKNYREYIDLNTIKEISPDFVKLYTSLDKYYAEFDKALSLRPSDLLLYTLAQYSGMKDSEQSVIREIVGQLEDESIRLDLVTDLLNKFKEQAVATKLVQQAMLVAQGKANFDTLQGIFEERDVEINPDEEDAMMVDMDLKSLSARVYNPDDALEWSLECLNRSLGPLLKGRFGFVFARPNAGKTTFLASQVTHMCKQIKLREDGTGGVLWCNNEEDGAVVGSRVWQSYFGVTQEELYTNGEKYEQMWNDSQMSSKFRLYDDAGMSKLSIEKRLARYKPRLIIVDQLDKVYGFKADRHDLLLKQIYQWAREIAKIYGAVVAVCQSGATGENKKWLEYTDVDSSHTAKQGEADFIVGIGKVNDNGYEYTRYIHPCKNKMPAGPRTDEMHRHGRFTVTIEPTIARYSDNFQWD